MQQVSLFFQIKMGNQVADLDLIFGKVEVLLDS